jgi:hypothetical protein
LISLVVAFIIRGCYARNAGIVATLAKPVNHNLLDWQVAAGFEDRVRQAFNGATLAEIARKIEYNYHTLRNQVKARRGIPVELLVGIAKTTNCTIDWLVTADGPKHRTAEGATGLSPEVRDEIRREIVKLLGVILMSDQDRSFADSLVEDLRKQIQK